MAIHVYLSRLQNRLAWFGLVFLFSDFSNPTNPYFVLFVFVLFFLRNSLCLHSLKLSLALLLVWVIDY